MFEGGIDLHHAEEVVHIAKQLKRSREKLFRKDSIFFSLYLGNFQEFGEGLQPLLCLVLDDDLGGDPAGSLHAAEDLSDRSSHYSCSPYRYYYEHYRSLEAYLHFNIL